MSKALAKKKKFDIFMKSCIILTAYPITSYTNLNHFLLQGDKENLELMNLDGTILFWLHKEEICFLFRQDCWGAILKISAFFFFFFAEKIQILGTKWILGLFGHNFSNLKNQSKMWENIP